MKTLKITRSALTLKTCAAVAAALAFLAANAMAQERGAERLVKTQRSGPETALQTPAGHCAGMACPKCTDTVVKAAQPMGKGGRAETALVQRHGCPACSTQVVTEGTGKQAQDKAVHTCALAGGPAASCCAAKAPAAGPAVYPH